jgi:SAM-dependent methyltransferase
MSDSARHDTWTVADHYEAYVGRWSRRLAPRFLDWFAAPPGLDWLEVGCGTGALSAAILEGGAPKSLLAIDSSEGFVTTAHATIADPRVRFEIGDAQTLAAPAASRDVIASGLCLNFVPDRAKALGEIRRVLRSGGRLGFYVWDYPGGGLQLVRAFWTAAAALDPDALDLTEGRRFPFCTSEQLVALVHEAGLRGVECVPIEMPTVFRDFDDYWQPFTRGTGPAPGYCANLSPDARERLRRRLHDTLSREADGSIAFVARAWAVRATAP